MSRHLKRLAAPKIWQIRRKKFKFITSPVSGPHSAETGMSLGTLLKETLNYANTNREVKKILNTSQVKIDGKIRKDFRFPVGVFDTIEFSNINEHFRVVISKKRGAGVLLPAPLFLFDRLTVLNQLVIRSTNKQRNWNPNGNNCQ